MAARRRISAYGLVLFALASVLFYQALFQIPSPLVNQAEVQRLAQQDR
jgi:hypothetical protein